MVRAGHSSPTRTRGGGRTGWVVACAAGALAFVVRWHLVGGAGGVRGYHGYDDGVYFSSAVAFVHGRMPYRDFLLLHPPGVVLALAPFAALTRWTSDPNALAAARVAFMAVGAVSTLLVTRLALRWGTAAAVVAGALYAVSSAAARGERLTLLEPLGTLTLLGAVCLLLRARAPDTSRWWLYAGGAVLGVGPVVKIWNVVPVLVVLAWQAWTQGTRSAVHVAGAAAGSSLLVLLPFALASPGAVVRLVLLAQLGRPRSGTTTGERLEGITGVGTALEPQPPGTRAAWTVVVCVAVAVAAVVAWCGRRGRLWVAVLGTQVAVLLVSPSFYVNYAAYSAAAVVLVVAAAVSLVPGGRPAWAGPRVWAAALTVGALGLPTAAVRPPPPETLAVAEVRGLLPEQGCVRADSPGVLAVLDVLSRDEERGCRTRVDVSGQTYVVGDRDDRGRPVPRSRNSRWQDDAVAYLTSGTAAVLVRATGNGFDDATVERLHRQGTLVRLRGAQVLLPHDAAAPHGPAARP
ncbi:DUF2029 domain-containing protein [Cellulomonas sp. zg-ZUI22]|uniref:glycosyltransferase 87 family protein n=1 Tax=Cellulomonas sp. zg-ZUI22 TaxID=2816955 RepID=UPI001A93F52F|nr:glycosyltransferase 87 family protein [Cellulomonas sp. zg-ZUI22]MBO0900426.1 DUF2029 domain-containing protein [Cellulomonas sp. zg-ZUI22]